MRAPRSLATLQTEYAAYRAKGGGLPLTSFAVQVGYTLDECLRAECGEGVRVGRKTALPADGTVVTVTTPPVDPVPMAAKRRRR